jgi:hypothetical protein
MSAVVMVAPVAKSTLRLRPFGMGLVAVAVAA